MCVSPIHIPNPNYGNKVLKMVDTTSKYIDVPCGYCSQCIATKQLSVVQRIQMESLFSHLFYCTLTYNEEMLPRLDVNGYKIPYADIKDFTNMVKRLYNDNILGVPFKVFAVSERGSEKGRPHFHCFFIVPKFYAHESFQIINLEMRLKQLVLNNWVRNIGSHRSPIYVPLCTYRERIIHNKLYRNYDLHYVLPSLSANGCADAAFYVTKYLLKSSDKEKRLQQALHLNLDPDKYNEVWPILKSRSFHSLGFGYNSTMLGRKMIYNPDIVERLRNGVLSSDKSLGYPLFFNPDTGASSPLCKQYKSNGDIYSYDDAMSFFTASGSNPYVDSVSSQECLNVINNFKKVYEVADSHSYDDLITNL